MPTLADAWAAEPLTCAQLIATWRRSRPDACQALQEAFFRHVADRGAAIGHDHDLAAAVLLAWNPPA